MEEVRWFSLKNTGVLVSGIVINGNSGAEYCFSNDIRTNRERIVDLADAGDKFKDGEIVYLEARVIGGRDNKASQSFVYRKTSNKMARYTIVGTTLANRLSYQGLVSHFTKIFAPIRFISLKADKEVSISEIIVRGSSSSYINTKSISSGEERILDLSETNGKIKEGDVVILEVSVLGGSNKTARQGFIYQESSVKRARYTISGTAADNTLSYNGLQDFFTVIDTPVRYVDLNNKSAFTARIRIHGDSDTWLSKDIYAGRELSVDLFSISELKDIDRFWLEVCVSDGNDMFARQLLTFQTSAVEKALYTLSGNSKNNTLSFGGVHMVGCADPVHPTLSENIMKIQYWENHRTGNGAWPGFSAQHVANGLKGIVSCYDQSKGYTTLFSAKPPFTSSGIIQGYDYPICGPVAVMFYLAKVNIRQFIDVITTLYDTGSLMGYKVPKHLRDSSANVSEKYRCRTAPEVNWMFQASLAQMESVGKIELDPSCIKMCTFVNEMERYIKFVFKAPTVRELSKWGTVKRVMKNLDEWIAHLNKGGVVFWLMNATLLSNIMHGEYERTWLGRISDQHWVVVLDAEIIDGNVRLRFHSWGDLWQLTLTPKVFRIISRTSFLFVVK